MDVLQQQKKKQKQKNKTNKQKRIKKNLWFRKTLQSPDQLVEYCQLQSMQTNRNILQLITSCIAYKQRQAFLSLPVPTVSHMCTQCSCVTFAIEFPQYKKQINIQSESDSRPCSISLQKIGLVQTQSKLCSDPACGQGAQPKKVQCGLIRNVATLWINFFGIGGVPTLWIHHWTTTTRRDLHRTQPKLCCPIRSSRYTSLAQIKSAPLLSVRVLSMTGTFHGGRPARIGPTLHRLSDLLQQGLAHQNGEKWNRSFVRIEGAKETVPAWTSHRKQNILQFLASSKSKCFLFSLETNEKFTEVRCLGFIKEARLIWKENIENKRRKKRKEWQQWSFYGGRETWIPNTTQFALPNIDETCEANKRHLVIMINLSAAQCDLNSNWFGGRYCWTFSAVSLVLHLGHRSNVCETQNSIAQSSLDKQRFPFLL